MTSFGVEIDELRRVIASLASCQQSLLDLGSDLNEEIGGLREHSLGRGSDAHAASYGCRRDGRAEMVTALAALRGLGEAAEGTYRGEHARDQRDRRPTAQ